jgi:succinate dehydrogenase hydrophobic anchor subunit
MELTFYNVMLHLHSVGRWIVLLLLLFAIFNSLIAGKRPFIKSDNRLGLLLTIFADLMLLIGIYLYIVGERGYKMVQEVGGMSAVMKNPVARFYVVEHLAGMLIAIVLIHIGKAQARKPMGDRAKHRRTMIFYFLALLIVLVSIHGLSGLSVLEEGGIKPRLLKGHSDGQLLSSLYFTKNVLISQCPCFHGHWHFCTAVTSSRFPAISGFCKSS